MADAAGERHHDLQRHARFAFHDLLERGAGQADRDERRLGHDRRGAGPPGQERELAEEVTGAETSDAAQDGTTHDLRGAIDHDVEGVAARALANDRASLALVHLFGERRHLAELIRG